jgi:hypothetical protein
MKILGLTDGSVLIDSQVIEEMVNCWMDSLTDRNYSINCYLPLFDPSNEFFKIEKWLLVTNFSQIHNTELELEIIECIINSRGHK